MSKLRNILSLIGGLVILGLIAWGVYHLIHFVWISFVSLQKEVATSIVAASATVLISVFTVVVSKYLERKREIEFQHREKKIIIYEKLMEKWGKIIQASRKQSQTNQGWPPPELEKELVAFWEEFARKLILWGPSQVIKKYSDLRNPQNPKEGLHKFEELLYAIRKDLGNSNRSLKAGDLLAVFISDIEKIKKPVGTSA